MQTNEFLHWIADRLVNKYGESPNVDFVLRLQEEADKAAINWQERYEKAISSSAVKDELFKSMRNDIAFAHDRVISERDDLRVEIREANKECDLLRNTAMNSASNLRALEEENARLQSNERDVRAAVIKELTDKLFG